MRKKSSLPAFLLSIISVISVSVQVSAAPSISVLHDRKSISVSSASLDDTNTAQILSECEIYTSQALLDQYMERDRNGNPTSTPLSDVIKNCESVFQETGENGKSIVEEIPTVSEIMYDYYAAYSIDPPENLAWNLENLDQLTYMMDFKYVSTDYRVIAGESVTHRTGTDILDNGMIEVSLYGGEIIRSSNMNDFVIIQIDPQTHQAYYLTMKEYDEKTGMYVVDFPCVGPYMVTQIMER